MEPTGDMVLCCRADQTTGCMGNVNTQTVEQVWKGEKYSKIRQQMINGEEPDACKICYTAETLGGLSKRVRENETWKDYSYLTNTPEVDLDIPYVDIRFNNICNLKCRSCRPLHSHSIANEYKQLGKPLSHEIVLKHKSPSIEHELDRLAPTIEEIYFCGGEPLLMDDHYRLLDKLIEVKNFDVRIRYSTNLTKLEYKNYNVLERWKYFKNVSVHASLDGIKSKLEYIRHGTKWNDILANLTLLKENNIEIKISPTTSVFNIMDISEICTYYVDNGFITTDDLGVSLLETPYYYSVQTLHPTLKELAKERIEKFMNTRNLSSDSKKRFQHIINYMMEKDAWQDNWQKFKSITTELDNFRNENFKETFPELAIQYD
tara:strand:+ start:5139 stop:6263 length:1125 start_codon:yes stop_codon:yes gene_type:complete